MFHSRTGATKRRLGGVAALGLTVALLATGCAATDDAAGGGGDGGNLAITFIPKNLGNAYFDTSDAGGKEAIDEFGGTYAEVAPDKGSPDGQVQLHQHRDPEGRRRSRHLGERPDRALRRDR